MNIIPFNPEPAKPLTQINFYQYLLGALEKINKTEEDIEYVSQLDRYFNVRAQHYTCNFQKPATVYTFEEYKEKANRDWVLGTDFRPKGLTKSGLDLIISVQIHLKGGGLIDHGAFFDKIKISPLTLYFPPGKPRLYEDITMGE